MAEMLPFAYFWFLMGVAGLSLMWMVQFLKGEEVQTTPIEIVTSLLLGPVVPWMLFWRLYDGDL